MAKIFPDDVGTESNLNGFAEGQVVTVTPGDQPASEEQREHGGERPIMGKDGGEKSGEVKAKTSGR